MHNQQLSVRLIRFKLLIKQLHYTNIEHINTIIIDITIIPMNPPHPSTFAYSLQDTVLRIQAAHLLPEHLRHI